MKTIQFSITFTLIIAFGASFGQDTPSTPSKKIRIQDVQVLQCISFAQNTNGTLADFKSLAPQSVLLNSSISDFSQYKIYNGDLNSSFSFMLGFELKNEHASPPKTTPQFRLGIRYLSASSLAFNVYKEDRTPYDTLISSQTNETVFLDSVNTEIHQMTYSSEQLQIDASLIFRTNPMGRWSLFTGIGIAAGVSLNAFTEIEQSQFSRTAATFSDGKTTLDYSSPNSNKKFEKQRNKTNFGASAYIPLGVDFRVGNKRDFWQQTHLFYEMRPSINVTSIPELHTVTQANAQHGIGLRISW